MGCSYHTGARRAHCLDDQINAAPQTFQPSGVSAMRWEGVALLKSLPHIAAPFLRRVFVPRLRPT